MNRNETAILEALQRGLSDWVDCAELAWLIREHTGIRDAMKVRERTIAVIKEMLTRELVEIGQLGLARGCVVFQPWSLALPDALSEIRRRWEENGNPWFKDKGDFLCWFSNTEKGDELVGRE